MTRLERRHRAWIAFALLSAAVVGLSSTFVMAYLAGVSGIALLYAGGISRRHPWRWVPPGLILLTLGLWRLGMQPSSVIPWPAALIAALLLSIATARTLAHFIRVPSRAVRAAAAASAIVAAILVIPLLLGSSIVHLVLLSSWLILASALVGTEFLWRRWVKRAGARSIGLSVMIITCNEADRIEKCLRQIAGWADEIVVVDSGSTDGTVDIARRYTDRVIAKDWSGYGRQKQFALEQCTREWVLNLDADEIISEPLKHEIDAWLSSNPGYRAFRICWVSIVFGKPVFFGADGRYHKRLFRREGARFDKAEVHEDIVTSGPVARLASPVYHDTFRDYPHLKSKFTQYAMISAEGIRARRRIAGPVLAALRGFVAFLLLYFRRLGILDGRRGLLMAVIYAVYTFDKYVAAWSETR